jgi:hypothetical protein
MPMATRRVPFDPADAGDLQTDQRQREVAAILAGGVIRMRVRLGPTSSTRRLAECMSQISLDSGKTRLELSRRNGPDGQCG